MSSTKKRWRFAAAAATANCAGAAAGLATQALIADPPTSVLVGTVVSGTVGDLLLQVARARTIKSAAQVPRNTGPGDTPSSRPGARTVRTTRCAGHVLHRGSGQGPSRTGYARCTGSADAPVDLSGSPLRRHTGAGLPRSPRHRQLHRAAQRRLRARHSGSPVLGGGDGTS